MIENFFTLQGKHILITGASSGIGKQCAISCSRQGAILSLVGRNIDKLNETKTLLDGEGHTIIVEDISDLENITGAVEQAVMVNGKLNGFIHSAGIEHTLPLKLHKPSIMNELMCVNTLSGIEFVRIISQKKYLSQESASFVLISSIMGVVGNGGLTGYSASKGALNSAVKSMAIELSKKKVRINTICPAHISNTAMSVNKEAGLSSEANERIVQQHPLGLGSVEDVANAAIFLLSKASKWITGTNLIVDGGYSAK